MPLFDLETVRTKHETKPPTPPPERQTKHRFDELVWALTDPVVLHRSPWANTLPQSVRGQIVIERLCALMTGEATATDAEAMAYIYPASLDSPMDHDWTQIYLYVSTRTLERSGKEVPPDVRVDELDDYKMGLLRDLKRSIYNSKAKHRVKDSLAKKQEQPEEPTLIPDVLPLFASS